MPVATERKLLTARLVESRALSDRTRHLEFEVQDAGRFDFIAGQFISMKAAQGEREVTRAYSIASAPHGNNRFDLCLNRVEQGFFSNFLCDLEAGRGVRFHGPHGYFVLKNPVRDSILIATGTGIAPIRGMLHWVFEETDNGARHGGREFWLVFGNRLPGDIYYHDEFTALAARFPNFHYLPTLSRAGAEWTGLRGYVQEHVRGIAQGRTDMDAYICGMKEMVIANRTQLLDLGWDKKSVVFERFD